ncbi:hypothetical protein [Streptomyces sp. NBC_01264]|uniref:hypothetical protein n=1 Tax=Streptomyces sp. NBC_01264 TaxID=2903804 RepID=UPI0022513181|nr:hypothetical protein [Streptomyces sp. NBC_01264]MCX4784080.1 hypothetical protein [Streptomyces sp. NBC_01264]
MSRVSPHVSARMGLPRRSVQLTRGAGRRAAARNVHPLIGLDTGDRPVHLTPADGHVLAVAPAGMGTTTLLRTLGAQALAAGLHVDILDAHMSEHEWARGLDRVTHAEEPDQIVRHLTGLAKQARGRAAAGVPGPARLVLVENHGTTDVLLNHQLDPRPDGVALDALTAVLAHGLQAGIQVVLTCAAVPPSFGHIARDLCRTRLLIDPDTHTWHNAGVPGEPYPPGEPVSPGLWHHLTPDDTRLLQAADLGEEDAAAYARRTPDDHRRRFAARTTKETHR